MNYLVVNLYNMYNQGETLQLKGLREVLPKDDITIAGIYSFLDDIELRRLRVKRVGTNRPGKLSHLVIKAAVLSLHAVMYRLTGKTSNDIIKAYAESDLILDFGGDTFNDRRAFYYMLGHTFPLFLSLIMNKPYAIVSQSFTGFRRTASTKLAQFILRRADKIIVRDLPSRNYLDTYKIKSKVTYDIGYLPVNLPSYKQSLIVGIAVNESWECYTEYGNHADVVYQLCHELYNQGYRIRLIAHAYAPGDNLGIDKRLCDADLCNKIEQELPFPVSVWGKEGISDCSHLIGFRLHPCISAISQGINTVAVMYDTKTACLPVLNNVVTISGYESSIKRIMDAFEVIKTEQPDIERINKIRKETKEAYMQALKPYSKLIGNYAECYLSESRDLETRQEAAQSGTVTELIRAAARNQHLTSEKHKDFDYNDSFYDDIKPPEAIKENGAIVGLPCHIRALKKKYPNNIYIGLFCGHTVKPEGVKLLTRSNKYKFRCKHNGSIGLYDGKQFINKKYYWNMFLDWGFIPECCLHCTDHTAELADISVGDSNRINGHKNIVIVRTEQGRELLRGANVNLEPITVKDVYRSQLHSINIKKRIFHPVSTGKKVVRYVTNKLSTIQMIRPVFKLWASILPRERIG